jgi:phosphoenolpyruvate---glycerone phosphotransferase subunit DhaL
MSEITTAGLIEMFNAIARAIEKDRDRLSELDGAIGDADHGVTMDMGFAAVTQALAGLDPAAEPTQVFNVAAKSFLNAVGASAGPLYATAFMRAGAAVKGKASLDGDALVAAVAAMAQGIQDRGKAERGEKTMVDAWLPAAEAIRAAASRGESLQACLDAAVRAAEEGAEATKAMLATKGRASRLGERVLGHVDPGAASAAVILGAMAGSLTV